MEVKQIATLTNNVLAEVLGTGNIMQEDLSNVVDVGNAIFDSSAFDLYVRTLVNHIGKVIFVNRPYSGSAPSVYRDAWEYGSVVEKIHSVMPTATENDSWDLVDGQTYDPHVFHKPVAVAKFFNKMTTFEIERSITERQVKQSFSSATQLNAFISMLFNETEKALTVRTDALIMRTINNFMAEIIQAEDAQNPSPRVRNLLTEYNTVTGSSLTAANALYSKEFIRFCVYQIALTTDRLTRMSTLFNCGGTQKFTPKAQQHVVLLSQFQSAADIYLQSDTYHDGYTKLVQAETVPFWQGSGSNFELSDTWTINVKCASTGTAISQSGILGVIFDHDAIGVMQENSRVTTQYNAKAEFTNYFYKRDCRYFNDMNENGVVFLCA